MIINVQVPEVAKLIWELFESLPEETKPLFAKRVDSGASLLEHPNLDGCVVFSVGGDDTL